LFRSVRRASGFVQIAFARGNIECADGVLVKYGMRQHKSHSVPALERDILQLSNAARNEIGEYDCLESMEIKP
jgi:hypothetical protein